MRDIGKRYLLPLLLFPLLLPGSALASGEVPTASSSFQPRVGNTFYSNAFAPANWTLEMGVSAPNPPNVKLLPTRKVDFHLPPASAMNLRPPSSMPVCPDSQVGPDADISAPVSIIAARCPKSILGNGTATFLLGKNNRPDLSPPLLLGQVLLFHGGLVGGQPKIKFWAYSYDTGVGIYTESVLSSEGLLSVPFPVLSYDSAVNSLEVEVPGRTKQIYLPPQDQTITLPGGQATSYVQARCEGGNFPFSADFLLGERLTDGTPFGDQVSIDGIGEGQACQGALATAKLASASVSGPGKVSRGKKVTYRVRISNSGALAAAGTRLSASGRGVRGSVLVGSVPGLGSKTVSLPLRFSSKGKITVRFLATSANGGSASVSKKITVG